MDIIYFSNITNTTHRYVIRIQETSSSTYRIPVQGEYTEEVSKPYILITPTYGDHLKRGHVPVQVRKFLNKKENRDLCVAVISTGNRNFGTEYGRAGNIISEKLNIPLLRVVELSGDEEDVWFLSQTLKQYNQTEQLVQIN